MKAQLQRLLALFPMIFACAAAAAAQDAPNPHSPVFNIMDYGAHNDGTGNASDAFRAAIAAAQKTGGGTVFVPAGHYVSGPIEMVSNLTLYFDAGAIVRFPAVRLPFTPGRQQGVETLTPVPLIGGHDLENVAVLGRGVLMSNNDDWMNLHPRLKATGEDDPGSANGPHWENLLNSLEAGKTVSHEEYEAVAAELRPSFIRFMNSKNILVDGLRFIGSPMWTVHLLYSENATVENLVIETYPGVHTDGIVIDSSRFIRLANDYIDTGDDGIVIKSGRTPTACGSIVPPKTSPSPTARSTMRTEPSPSAARHRAAFGTSWRATLPRSIRRTVRVSRAAAAAVAWWRTCASTTGRWRTLVKRSR